MSVLSSLRPRTTPHAARISGTLADADDWLFDALGAAPAVTGQRITRRKAMGHAPIFRAIQLISGDVARVPLHVLKRTPKGGKDRATTHAAYPLLRHNATPAITAYRFRMVMQGHALFFGNAYALIVKAGAIPIGLVILDPENTYPVREDGRLWYVTTMDGEALGRPGLGTREFKFEWSEVLHIAGFGFDGLVGYNVLKLAKDSWAPGIAARDYGSRFFSNNARPSVVLEYPGTLQEPHAKKLREGWEAMYKGLDNAWRTAVLDRGVTAKTLTISAKDSQLMEARKYDLIEVANWFSLPTHKLGGEATRSYGSLEQENQSYLQEALDRWLVEWESECRNKLLTEPQKRNDSHLIEFQREALVATDLKTKVESIAAEVNGGLMTLDQANAIRSRPAVGGRLGRSYRIQKGFAMVDPELDTEQDQDSIEFVREVVRAWAADPTIGDVLFNLTSTEDLLELAGLPVEPERIEPWLPVLTPDGRLVSGEVVLNEAGEIVGGDVLDGAAAPEPAADDEESVDELSDERARELFGAIRRVAPQVELFRALRTASSANRQAVLDVAGRMVGRMIVRIRRAAGKPDRFVQFVESLDDDVHTIEHAFHSPILAYFVHEDAGAYASFGAASWLIAAAQSSALSAAECSANDLRANVEKWCTAFGEQAPARLMDAIQGVRNGTAQNEDDPDADAD